MAGKTTTTTWAEKTTRRKTRSLTRADEQLLKDEKKVKVKRGAEDDEPLRKDGEKNVKEEAKANTSALKSGSSSGKKVVKRSLDKVLVDLKAKADPEEVSANEEDVEEEVFEVENDSFEEVDDSAEEAQETIRDLKSKLSRLEDEYVEMKAENLSKDQKIRKMSLNLNKVDEKFKSFKNDRADLVRYMKLNVDLIKKLEIVNEAVKARDSEIESLKNGENEKKEKVTHQDIENMRTVMAKQNRMMINLEVKVKETAAKEEIFKTEKSKLLLKVENLEEQLKSHNTLKIENDALRNTIDEKTTEFGNLEKYSENEAKRAESLEDQLDKKTIEFENLEKDSENEKKKIDVLKGQLDSFKTGQEMVFSKLESMQKEHVHEQNLVTKLRNEKSSLINKAQKLKLLLEKTEEKLSLVKAKENIGKENENIVVDLEESIKVKNDVIDQLELENNKLFRQNVENLKAEKEKSKELETKVRALEKEKLAWAKSGENQDNPMDKEITLDETVKSEKYRIPKLKRESEREDSKAKAGWGLRKETEGKGYK